MDHFWMKHVNNQTADNQEFNNGSRELDSGYILNRELRVPELQIVYESEIKEEPKTLNVFVLEQTEMS